MSNVSFEFSVGRWHKISERLAAKASELAEAAKKSLCSTYVDGYAGEEQVDRLRSSASDAVKALADQDVAARAVAAIRSAVGRANAQFGVSDALAEQERLNRRIKLLREILSAQRPEMVAVDALKDYRPFGETKTRMAYRHEEPQGAIQVRTLEASFENAMREEIERLQAELFSVSDKANDSNVRRISVEISAEAAAMIGLKA